MSTMMGHMRRVLWGTAGGVIALFAANAVQAQIASDKPGAVLIFPKIVVDTQGIFGPPTDTEIQMTNTSPRNPVVGARCFLVDATSYCSNSPTTACTAESESDPATRRCTAGGVCLPRWAQTDFQMTLTKRQPISWKASYGLDPFPCDGVNTFCADGRSNRGADGSVSRILGAQQDPFFGEMKCVEVDPNDFLPTVGFNPANNAAGDLKGEVTIVSKGAGGSVDARKYNAIALQSTLFQDGEPLTLNVGGPEAEYSGCPNVIVVDHFFDNAMVCTHGSANNCTGTTATGPGPNGYLGAQPGVTTHLTFVPCTQDLGAADISSSSSIALQFLVFNEFEQRFSTSTNVACWREVQLSDIDTRAGLFGNNQSIFNFAVQGTITGQSRIRSVSSGDKANGIVAVAEEFWRSDNGPGGRFTSAANVHYVGTRALGDRIIIPPGP